MMNDTRASAFIVTEHRVDDRLRYVVAPPAAYRAYCRRHGIPPVPFTVGYDQQVMLGWNGSEATREQFTRWALFPGNEPVDVTWKWLD